MKKALAFVAILAIGLAVALPALASSEPTKGSWTGWISDSHCGEKGANAKHTKACAEKCMKDGGQVVFFNNADKKSYNLDFNRDNRFLYDATARRVKDIDLLTNWGDKSKTHNPLAHEAFAAVGSAHHWCFQVRVQQVTPANAANPTGHFFSIADMMEATLRCSPRLAKLGGDHGPGWETWMKRW